MGEREPEDGEDGADDHEDHHSDEEHLSDEHHHDDHHHHHDVVSLGAAVVTVSSSRTLSDDPAGDTIVDALEAEGHDVQIRDLIVDDFDGVQDTVNRVVKRDDVDIVVTTGGTGVTPDDVTIEAVAPLLEKRLPGFGELFRRLSYDEIGTHVVGTRTAAGIADNVPVFCLPGSENAVRLGMKRIIVDVAPHLAGLATRESSTDDLETSHDDPETSQ